MRRNWSFSILCSSWLTNFNSCSSPFYRCFTHSTMNPMPSWIIFLLLWGRNNLRTFSSISRIAFLINSNSISSKNSTFFLLYFRFIPWRYFLRLDIIQWRSKVHINISINNAYSSILILRGYLENINLELIIKDLNAYRISFMQAGKVSQLILQNRLRVLHIDEFSLMGLQFDHMPHMSVLLLHIGHQSDSCRRSRLWEFKHLEHPIWNIAQSFFSNKL